MTTAHLPTSPAASDPAGYPWTPLPRSCLITADTVAPMRCTLSANRTDPLMWTVEADTGTHGLDTVLAEHGVPLLRDRFPVLSIGSNRSAVALRRKYAALDAWAIPVTAVTVTGLALGYAACVSGPGWVPWAPRAEADAVLDLQIAWVSDEERAILDATEPNYVRSPLPDVCRAVVHGQYLEDVTLYRSRHGLIGDAAGGPHPAGDQTTGLALVAAALGRACSHAEFAIDATLRDAARAALAVSAVIDGFDTL